MLVGIKRQSYGLFAFFITFKMKGEGYNLSQKCMCMEANVNLNGAVNM